jgi:hypothetical protein
MIKYSCFTVRLRRIIFTTLLSISILSCGGEGALMTAGISGTGIVLGVITGFGSIFVNGVEYDIDQASIDVDGVSTPAHNNNLAIGMVVRLAASDNGDGTGLASSVVYDDAIEGLIEDVVLSTVNKNLKSLNILGQTVLIDAASTTFTIDNGTVFSFDTIAKGDIVEVSGFTDLKSSTIIATRVEKKVGHQNGPIPVELHGAIESLGANTITVQGVSVDISSIDDSNLTDLDEAGLKVGVHVEVNGVYVAATSSIRASHIEGEDDDIQKLTHATGEISLQGIVSEFTHGDDFFELNGIVVDVSGIDSSITRQLKEGIQVQIKGQYSGTELIAQKLDVRSGESEFEAIISSIDDIANKRIQIEYPKRNLTVELLFDNQSQLVDESRHDHSVPMTLDQLVPGDHVKAQVKRVGTDWVVVSLKHDHHGEYKIRGFITEVNDTDYTVTVNGLTVALSVSAYYEINDKDSNRQAFFDAIDVNDSTKSFVDIEGRLDNNEAVFNEVELDSNH